MNYWRNLKQGLSLGGLLFLGSLLVYEGIRLQAVIAAFLTFFIYSLQNFGSEYIALTNQSKIVEHSFGIIVKPLAIFIPIVAFFYIGMGFFSWFFCGVAAFIALIFFVIELTDLIDAIKKS